MNTDFPRDADFQDRCRSIEIADDAVFAEDRVFKDLRETLAREVSSSALLAELLEKVNLMQRAKAAPEEFNVRFAEFVCRAEEHLEAVRSFFPALVTFLPSNRG